MATVFKKFSHEERAFINPQDVTKRNPEFFTKIPGLLFSCPELVRLHVLRV